MPHHRKNTGFRGSKPAYPIAAAGAASAPAAAAPASAAPAAATPAATAPTATATSSSSILAAAAPSLSVKADPLAASFLTDDALHNSPQASTTSPMAAAPTVATLAAAVPAPAASTLMAAETAGQMSMFPQQLAPRGVPFVEDTSCMPTARARPATHADFANFFAAPAHAPALTETHSAVTAFAQATGTLPPLNTRQSFTHVPMQTM